MLILAAARRWAIWATVPGRSSRVRSRAGSSPDRILASARAFLALPGSLTTIRILPRPPTSAAQIPERLTPAAARLLQILARTPGLEGVETVSWVILAMAAPPGSGWAWELASHYQERRENTSGRSGACGYPPIRFRPPALAAYSEVSAALK